MSPYQQQVIDTTLAEFDKQAQIGKFGLGKSASDAGAFGGARHGIAQSEYQLGSDANRAAIQAQLLQGGFGQGTDTWPTRSTEFNRHGSISSRVTSKEWVNSLDNNGCSMENTICAGVTESNGCNQIKWL